MTVGTCAWMEKEWMNTIPDKDIRMIEGMRYMDDVMVGIPKDMEIKIQHYLENELYWEPLKLGKTEGNIFLETEYDTKDIRKIRYWLKDPGEGTRGKVWRYHHYDSGLPFHMKKSCIRMCLIKIGRMSSDDEVLIYTALDRLIGFVQLGYPIKLLQHTCANLARDTGNRAFFEVRDLLYHTHDRSKGGCRI